MGALIPLFLIILNLSSTLFLASTILGTTITVRAKSWIIIWVGLEVNLLAFIPLINKNKTPYEREASIKYFIVQAIASIILLITIILEGIIEANTWLNIILISALIIKIGAAPFHIWFPRVIQGLSWANCIILITWQKIAPIIIISYKIRNGIIRNIIIISRVMVGALGGLNQTSIRKIIAYSSIRHLGWIIIAIIIRNWYWIIYFSIYTMLNIAVIILLKNSSILYLPQVFSLKIENKTKFTLLISILSLGGLPPFLGFLPKWIIIQNSIIFNNKLTIIVIVITTIVTLYFYLRVAYRGFSLQNQLIYWINENVNKSIVFISTAISLISIPIISIINLY